MSLTVPYVSWFAPSILWLRTNSSWKHVVIWSQCVMGFTNASWVGYDAQIVGLVKFGVESDFYLRIR